MRVGHSTFARLGLVAVGLCAGCSEASTKQPYEFVIRIQSDPGRPLASATLYRAGVKLGASDGRGSMTLAARGAEGETLAFEVRCPDGHRSPGKPLSIVLRRSTQSERRPEYVVSCPPLKRKLVVAVRADNGPNLPVRHLGREIARTDASGAAHVLLEAQAEDSLELTLDTSEHADLRPSNPSARFAVAPRDEVATFNQKFESLKPKTSGAARRAPRGPRRIQ
ncbi:MAG TPA: hypothetical protein VK524_28420 [Polyangiaceae bacterium]|jgi:hypothetical protein|nr:hypothetical protein [Polyangiaceae bacterium]